MALSTTVSMWKPKPFAAVESCSTHTWRQSSELEHSDASHGRWLSHLADSLCVPADVQTLKLRDLDSKRAYTSFFQSFVGTPVMNLPV